MQRLLLTPPSGYQAVEESLYRCHGPLAPKHIPFLESLSITAIVNVSSEPIFVPSSSSSNSGIDLSAIAMHNIPMDLTSNTIHLQTIFDALELIFSLHKFKILLIGDTKLNFDCLLVACIRRLQRFSMTSLLSEYRFNSTLRNFDAEQLIESLDRESMLLACCSTHIPSYIEAFAKENKEEKRMIEEGLQREHALSVTSLPSDEERREEMKRKKELLHLLFPSLSSNALMHTTFEYDPNLSLILDKDEDD